MLSKIIGAALGGKLAQQSKSMGGTTGAMIGAAAPFVLSRISLPAMIALGVGGYAAKKYFGKSSDEQSGDAAEQKPLKNAVPTKPKPARSKPAKAKPPVASIPQPATS